MNLTLSKSFYLTPNKIIQITGSKSESNRLLILQALAKNFSISNLSNSDDTNVLKQALKSDELVIDIHHAGTAMRFLTAYFATQSNKDVIITGSSRMQERPIGVLVDALRNLGVEITYENNEGYPPIRIKGREIDVFEVDMKANVSSQYISALLLIAPFLKNGLTINLIGELTSVPYIKMTLSLLNELGFESQFNGKSISIFPNSSAGIAVNNEVIVESDWSSASYFYSIIALAEVGASITLSAYKNKSLQGDSVLSQIYKEFGVTTKFNGSSITLTKSEMIPSTKEIILDLVNSPDIAQTIAVTCFGLGLYCHLKGLHTLKIKETDRLEALKQEISKLGGVIEVSSDTLTLQPAKSIHSGVSIATYQDHRMAMAFAPLALKTDLIIEDFNVVSKSYPDFWEDLKLLNFKFN